MSLTIEPVTPDRWDDLVTLFGPRGAVAGCWCMWWRLSAKEWESKAYDGNRRSMKELVDAGERPGLLAYRDGEPVGWVSVAPREQFPRIERSRVLGPVAQVGQAPAESQDTSSSLITSGWLRWMKCCPPAGRSIRNSFEKNGRCASSNTPSGSSFP